MRKHVNRAHDYFATCPETGKRSYLTRKDARKARQAGGHVHGSPYKCHLCGYFHLGRMLGYLTRDHYRQTQAGHVHIHAAAKELGISRKRLLEVLDIINVTPEHDHIPADVLHQLKALTYR